MWNNKKNTGLTLTLTVCLETKGLVSILALTNHVALDPELHFQIATSSRKTWVKTASAPMFAKFLISMLPNEKGLAESL